MQSAPITHQPCQDCGSSDALTLYPDSSYCFSCQTRKRRKDSMIKGNTVMKDPDYSETKDSGSDNVDLSSGSYYAIRDRNIDKDVCEKYGVTVSGVRKDKQVILTKHYYPYYSRTGEDLVASKVRTVATKEFVFEGSAGKAGLFGLQLFPKGCNKSITITEGELDALAAFQMQGKRYPCVSLRNGAQGAVKDCQQNYKYLDSFEQIYLCFDNDEHGKAAARRVAKLFPGKARIVQFDNGFKDACDYLKADKAKEFTACWWKGELYVPEEIITGNKLFDLVADKDPVECFNYPWAGLNELTYGYRLGETVVISAHAKIGKTIFIREIIHHALHNHPKIKAGTIFLEGPPKEHALGFISLEANKPLHLPDTVYTEKEFEEAKSKLPVDRLCMYKKYGTVTPEGILSTMRYYIKGLGCNLIILDNLMALVSSSPTTEEREALNSMMTQLVKLAEDNNAVVFVVAHLNREDKIHGTSLIEKQANMILRLERDKMADNPVARNTTKICVTENRFSGETGVACELLYNKTTGRLDEQILSIEEPTETADMDID